MRVSQVLISIGSLAFLALLNAQVNAIGFDPTYQANPLVYKTNKFNKSGQDPLVKISKLSNGGEFAPIGKIVVRQYIPWGHGADDTQDGKGLEGTGFLVSPCLILTNYHVVFGKSKTPNETDFSVTFTANREVVARPIAWGSWHQSKLVSKDVALLKLEGKDCLGLEVGFLRQEWDFLSLKIQNLLTAGYPGSDNPQNDRQQLWGQLRCEYKNPSSEERYLKTIFNDCALLDGMSGSPLLVRNNEGKLKFIGIQSTDLTNQAAVIRRYEIKYANIAVDAGFLDDKILDLIDADIARHK